MRIPETVCPFPFKIPLKVGIPEKSIPVRSISAVMSTVSPALYVSRTQFFARFISSCPFETVMVRSAAKEGKNADNTRHSASTAVTAVFTALFILCAPFI